MLLRMGLLKERRRPLLDRAHVRLHSGYVLRPLCLLGVEVPSASMLPKVAITGTPKVNHDVSS